MSGAQQRKRIGDYMMEKGLIHQDWIAPILEHSKSKGIRFGESAVALGYVTEKDLQRVLNQPYGRQLFFSLNPRYFPEVTSDLFSVEEIVRYGVLPLGYKNEWKWFRSIRRLNLGLLNPERKESVKWAVDKIETVKAFKIFQLLPEEFLQTLELCYGVDRSALLEWNADRIDGNLLLYLQLEKKKRPTGAQAVPK